MFGGVLLDLGLIVEMKIGEGKIIILIVFVYLNVFSGKGVIVLIVNEYLV